MANTAPRARPAHAPGPTFLSYTPNGRKLVTVGVNDALRVFETGSDGEPITINDTKENNLAVVASDTAFFVGSEDGNVCKFSLETNALDNVLVRCSMPIRDLAISPNGQWLAVASDDMVIKIVDTENLDHVLQIRELSRPAKHLTFDPSGNILTASCSDGSVHFYSLKEEQPELIRRIDALVRAIETDDEASAKVQWHPDGRAFAAPTPTRDVQVMSQRDWASQRAFKDGHFDDITAHAWSPNGALLVTAGRDRNICLWETKTQKVVQRLGERPGVVLDFAWHPTDNILCYTNNDGELYIHENFVDAQNADMLQKELQPAPFIHDPLKEISGNAQRVKGVSRDGQHNRSIPVREDTPDSLDDLDGFIEDDENGVVNDAVKDHRKRSAAHLDPPDYPSKRSRTVAFEPHAHDPFQPGSTPWMGDRKFLCLNLLGLVWTVDHNTSSESVGAQPHRTITVEFYDRTFQRDFKFTDPFGYDFACVGEKGCLFASPSFSENQPAQIYYRPHEHWTTERPDWRMSLPKGEEPMSLALSDKYIVLATSKGYLRSYTLFGTPVRIWRTKSPVVACATWRDYVITVGNGSVDAAGRCTLRYSIHALCRDDTLQNEDALPLPEGAQLKNVFFSDAGDPCVYDTTGTLLILSHWRDAGHAQWVPLLDTTHLERLKGGKKDETYWPVGVAESKFYCFILKGGDLNPSIYPRPLLTDFGFEIPVTSALSEDTGDDEAKKLEEQWVQTSLLHSLQQDLVEATQATRAQREELARREQEMDVLVLRLLGAVCATRREEQGMRALEIASLLKDANGSMMEKAALIAGRFGMEVLKGKVSELAEARMVGLDTHNEP